MRPEHPPPWGGPIQESAASRLPPQEGRQTDRTGPQKRERPDLSARPVPAAFCSPLSTVSVAQRPTWRTHPRAPGLVSARPFSRLGRMTAAADCPRDGGLPTRMGPRDVLREAQPLSCASWGVQASYPGGYSERASGGPHRPHRASARPSFLLLDGAGFSECSSKSTDWPPRSEVYRIGVVAHVGGTQQGSTESFGVGSRRTYPWTPEGPPISDPTNRNPGGACGAAYGCASAGFPPVRGLEHSHVKNQEERMKTPRVNRGCKASPVKVTRADGTVEMRPAYDLVRLRRVQGHGPTPPRKPDQATSPTKRRRK